MHSFGVLCTMNDSPSGSREHGLPLMREWELSRSLFGKLSMFYERSGLARSALIPHVLGTTRTVLVNTFVKNEYHFWLRYVDSLVSGPRLRHVCLDVKSTSCFASSRDQGNIFSLILYDC